MSLLTGIERLKSLQSLTTQRCLVLIGVPLDEKKFKKEANEEDRDFVKGLVGIDEGNPFIDHHIDRAWRAYDENIDPIRPCISYIKELSGQGGVLVGEDATFEHLKEALKEGRYRCITIVGHTNTVRDDGRIEMADRVWEIDEIKEVFGKTGQALIAQIFACNSKDVAGEVLQKIPLATFSITSVPLPTIIYFYTMILHKLQRIEAFAEKNVPLFIQAFYQAAGEFVNKVFPHLFSVEWSKFSAALENVSAIPSSVPNPLSQKFNDHGISLSDAALIVEISEPRDNVRKWKITDGTAEGKKKIYAIRKEGEVLNARMVKRELELDFIPQAHLASLRRSNSRVPADLRAVPLMGIGVKSLMGARSDS